MRLIKSLAAIGLALYSILLLGFGWITINLDNKGTDELPIQSWTEFTIIVYVLTVAAILFFIAYYIINSGQNIRKRYVWFPILVLMFHGTYFLYSAEGEMVFYLSMLHIPLIIGIISSVAIISKETGNKAGSAR
jgi:multisubunit Na+/H+ antiporter MnhF subunit